jgi:hypothetical protein
LANRHHIRAFSHASIAAWHGAGWYTIKRLKSALRCTLPYDTRLPRWALDAVTGSRLALAVNALPIIGAHYINARVIDAHIIDAHLVYLALKGRTTIG